jgi:hypothetical protein
LLRAPKLNHKAPVFLAASYPTQCHAAYRRRGRRAVTEDEQAVIIRPYWRLWGMNADQVPRAAIEDLSGDVGPEQLFGLRENIYCVHFSVAGRALEHSDKLCRLAAVRWPEEAVVCDDGTEIHTQAGKSQ